MATSIRVTTNWLGPTDTKGGRIRVTTPTGRHEVPKDYGANDFHRKAVVDALGVQYEDITLVAEHARGYHFRVVNS